MDNKIFNLRNVATIVVCLAVSLIFSSCDDDSGGGGGGGNGSGNASVINATNVVNGNSSIVTVKALIVTGDNGIGYELATSAYENNGFKLTLPATVHEQYLMTISEDLEDDDHSLEISDRQAHTTGIISEMFCVFADNSA